MNTHSIKYLNSIHKKKKRWKKYFLIDCNMTQAKQRVNGAIIEQIAMKESKRA